MRSQERAARLLELVVAEGEEEAGVEAGDDAAEAGVGMMGEMHFEVLRAASAVAAPVPAAELKGHEGARGTEIVGGSAVHHRPRNNHSTNTQSRNGLSLGAARVLFVHQTTFEDVDHGLEDGFKGAPSGGSTASDVGRQGDHGTRILYVFEMLAGEIGAHNLGADICG